MKLQSGPVWPTLSDMRKTSITPLALALLAAIACGRLDFAGMIWAKSDTPDQRFEQSLEYNNSVGPVKLSVPDNDYRVYAFGDSHVDFSTKNLDTFVRDYLDDEGAAPFAICVGDLINSTGHYDLFKDHIKEIGPDSQKRLFICVGNHDLYFGQWTEYKERFKTSTYKFEVETPSEGTDLYISLDSGSGTLGVKQRDWLGDVLTQAQGKYRNIVVFTHTHFFMRDYSQGTTDNFSLEETHDLMNLFSKSGVKLVISGHDHYREEVRHRGVYYSTLDALGDPYKNASYAVFSIGKDRVGINYETFN